MFWFKKKDHLELHQIDRDKRERLFFHDIINQTHGLILFLNQRKSTNKIISVLEIELLEKEIRTLQNLIKDHYQFGHKNLSQKDDWVPFKIAFASVENLIHNYFSKKDVKIFITNELINDDDGVVHFSTFYRIMNNLIKNMAEARGSEIKIHFKIAQNGLEINTENKIIDINTQESKGLGLESIRHLANESGGKFIYETSNGLWLNHVFLPSPKAQSFQELQKKAA